MSVTWPAQFARRVGLGIATVSDTSAPGVLTLLRRARCLVGARRKSGIESASRPRPVNVGIVTEETRDRSSQWKTFGERVIYDNPWVWLGQVDVQLPDGERFWHHVVRLHRAAMMVLVDERDRVLLLWRHRFVQDGWGLICYSSISMS